MKKNLSIGFAALGFALVLSAVAQSPVRTEYSVGLQWEPGTETDLGGYRVYVGPASNVWTHTKAFGLETRVQMPLPGPGTWFLAVTATNRAGLESDLSNVVTYTATNAAPSAPIQLRAAGGTVTQIINYTNLIVLP